MTTRRMITSITKKKPKGAMTGKRRVRAEVEIEKYRKMLRNPKFQMIFNI